MVSGGEAGAGATLAAPGLLPVVSGGAGGPAEAEAGIGEIDLGRVGVDGERLGQGAEQCSTSGREDPTSPVNSSLQVTTALVRLCFSLVFGNIMFSTVR